MLAVTIFCTPECLHGETGIQSHACQVAGRERGQQKTEALPRFIASHCESLRQVAGLDTRMLLSLLLAGLQTRAMMHSFLCGTPSLDPNAWRS